MTPKSAPKNPMWELIKLTLINGGIGSVGASTFLFLYYLIRLKVG